MKAQQLRNSILQYAMRGKLVDQDPNDEPVNILLKKIKVDKEQLIKDKVIKRLKALNPISDEKIPFDTPASWQWVRIGEISNSIRAGGDKPKEFSEEKQGDYTVPVIANGKTNSGIVGYTKQATVSETCITVSGRGTIGYSCIRNEPFYPIVRLIVIKPNDQMCIEFLKLALEILVENGVGTSIKQLTVPMISPKLIPIPPLKEQKRIVEKIEELFKMVEQYEVLEQELTVLNSTFPTNMEKSILQYAMQGKLIEQDPNDEPASVLLKHIAEEKEQLIKDKVIKREKVLPPITDEEIPFEIPDSWEWVRLNSISNIGNFQSVKGSTIEDHEWVLDLEEIEKNSGTLLSKIKKVEKQVNSNKYIFKKGNVLYGKLRPYLNKVIVADENGYCTTEILPLSFSKYIDSDYAKYALMSPYFLSYANNCSYGVKMPRLGTQDAKKALFPLPPLTEQQRIVKKIEAMLLTTKGLKSLLRD